MLSGASHLSIFGVQDPGEGTDTVVQRRWVEKGSSSGVVGPVAPLEAGWVKGFTKDVPVVGEAHSGTGAK